MAHKHRPVDTPTTAELLRLTNQENPLPPPGPKVTTNPELADRLKKLGHPVTVITAEQLDDHR